MNKHTINTALLRRRFLKNSSILGLSFLGVSAGKYAYSQEPYSVPRLSEDDSTAKALGYVHDATQADENRTNENAFCHNCIYFQGERDDQWAGCQIFPGKAVNVDGWCRTWGKKI